MRALVMALALAACSAPDETPAPEQTPAPSANAQPGTAPSLDTMPSWENARAAGVDFRGVGQEPGWLLDIHQQNRIVLVWDYGENAAEFPLNDPIYPQEGATRYETRAGERTLTVTIRRHPCQDGMSGQPYPATVEVVIDGRTLNGCGRSV